MLRAEELPEHRIFIATDNAATQDALVRRYGARAVTNQPICRTRHVRQTTLVDAVVDLLVCTKSDRFMGSFGSSFSDTIAHLRSVSGRACPGDSHAFMGWPSPAPASGSAHPARTACAL